MQFDLNYFIRYSQHFGSVIAKAKSEVSSGETQETVAWYPCDTLSCFIHINEILKSSFQLLSVGESPERILDIGCADGSLGFLFESLGNDVDFLDNPSTNYNELVGLKKRHSQLKSKATIIECDLDRELKLTRNYRLCFCLGLLYHLKNPYLFLEGLSYRAEYCVLSTKIFQVVKGSDIEMTTLPVAYLVGDKETNFDATNFWVFSYTGLRQILGRCGWEILEMGSVGCHDKSDPSSPDKDERAFCLLKSSRKIQV